MSNLTRRQFLRVSAVATAGAVLAACGKTKTTEPPATQVPVVAGATAKPVEKPTEAPKGPQRPSAWPVGDVPRNRTLVYSYGIPTAGVFNAYTSGWNHQTGSTLVNEPCAFYAVHADKEILWLAESYKPSADAKEWTITFRKGIKWSDGTAFKASDAAWGMEVLKRVAGTKTPGSFPKELEKTEAIDDVTLKVTLNQTDWRFFFKDLTHRFDLGDDDVFVAPQMFAGVADADMVALNVYDQAKGWPISTGPYGVGVSNDQLSNFDLRPTWWAADTGFAPKYPDVWRLQSIPYTSDTLGAQQLINKEVDQTLDLRPFVVASILAQAEHLKTWTGRKPPYGYLDWWPISVQFCTAKPPFDNPKVRWAIAYAIDQQKVVDIGWNGAGTVAYGPFPNFPKLVALMDGIKDLTDQYNVLEFNLDKSAALMTEAGFTKDSEGFWVDAEGKRPDSDIYAATPLFGDLAPIVAEQLRQAGFFSQHKVPPDVWAAKVDGRASMFLFGHGGATIDPYDTFNLYTAVPPEMGQQSWGNITRWQNPDWIAITQEMNNTAMDDPKMKDLFRKGMELYYKELPDCPLVQWYHRIPLNTYYWDNWPDETNPYMNAAIWHLTGFQVVYGLKATDKT
jgi:peptide/nickel transport system substrate-binding protein